MNEKLDAVIELPEGLSALPPTQDQLECSDGEPMATEFHVWQMQLLIEPLRRHFVSEPVYAAGNMFVCFSPDQLQTEHFKGPDVFVVKGVRKEFRKCWVVWQETKGPDVVIELLSDSTQREHQTRKKDIYEARLRVPGYYWFHPERPEEFAGFGLVNGRYEPIAPDSQGRLVCRQLDLLLARWTGAYPVGQSPRTWLRWTTFEGVPLPTGDETAEQKRQNVERERQRMRALAAKLPALGIEPEV